jgi:hypothetical protein
VPVLVAACGGSSGKKIPPSALPRLVLSQAQVGAAYTEFEVGRQLHADTQPGRADPTRFGREGGWIARYRKRTGPGPLVVESRADLFAGASGAHDDLAAYAAIFAAASQSGISHPRGLGQEATALQYVQGGGTNALRNVSVAWRELNATGSVTVQGFARTTTLAGTLQLARVQERAFARAAR